MMGWFEDCASVGGSGGHNTEDRQVHPEIHELHVCATASVIMYGSSSVEK